MKKLRTFLHVFKNSTIKPAYYAQVLKAPFSFSFKYFAVFFSLLSLMTVVAIAIFFQTQARPYLTQLEQKLPSLYPPDLEITIKDGQLNTNAPEPYFVPLNPDLFPENIKESLQNNPTYNILVIDTLAQPTDIRDYQTFALVTAKDVAFMGENGEIRIQSLEEIKDFNLNKQVFDQFLQKAVPWFKKFIPVFFIALIIFFPLTNILSRFFYLMFFSLTTWVVARTFKNKAINYTKSLQINLHAITLPTIVVITFQSLGVQPQIPFFQSIILLIFNLLVFSALREKK